MNTLVKPIKKFRRDGDVVSNWLQWTKKFKYYHEAIGISKNITLLMNVVYFSHALSKKAKLLSCTYRITSENCEFGTMRNDLIKDRIVCGIRDNALCQHLLKKRDLALTQAIDICRTAEITEKRLEKFHNDITTVQEITHSKKGVAYGVKCYNCNGNNHFARMCHVKKKVKEVLKTLSSSSSSEGDMIVDEVKCSECSVARVTSMPVGCGQEDLCVSSVSRGLSAMLDLIRKVDSVHTQAQDPNLLQLVSKYTKCFMGIGELPGTYKMVLMKYAKLVIHVPRKVPAALREPLKKEMDRLVTGKTIIKLEKPTEWVNFLVMVHKRDNSIQICLDQQDLNNVLMREHFPLPTLKLVTSQMAGTYLSRFVTNLAEVIAPLRVLMNKDVQWHWEHEQNVAFKSFKDVLFYSPILHYYDINKLDTLSVYASQTGLGAVLLQKGWPDKFREVPPEVKQFGTYTKDLSCAYGLVLKGNAIVVSKYLQHKIIECIHAAHQGTDKCSQRVRGTVFWPGITADIAKFVNTSEMGEETLPHWSSVSSHMSGTLFTKPLVRTILSLMACQSVIFKPLRELLKRDVADHKGLDMVLLEMHHTPIINGFSPAHLLMGENDCKVEVIHRVSAPTEAQCVVNARAYQDAPAKVTPVTTTPVNNIRNESVVMSRRHQGSKAGSTNLKKGTEIGKMAERCDMIVRMIEVTTRASVFYLVRVRDLTREQSPEWSSSQGIMLPRMALSSVCSNRCKTFVICLMRRRLATSAKVLVNKDIGQVRSSEYSFGIVVEIITQGARYCQTDNIMKSESSSLLVP
ncbi:hypothetical protein PR048_002080 [Dryococelus australis]|uniref:RNA-directed DNA polymerase n=1 Tax=Dryococelus australis TaxID=614101 RepID=A0ABQ9IJ55_9NEOP|nr:hypothetical protein PR048_002080 [Dryococelus australis]